MARADELTDARHAVRLGLPWWCLAAAVLAHLALLGSGAQALDDWKRQQLLPKPSFTPPAVKVRSVAAPEDAVPPAPQPSWAPVLTGTAETVTPLLADAALKPVAPGLSEAEPALYVPRALLTVAPAVRAPVMLQWPANWPVRRSYTAVLKLYLDEQGRVQRVEPDGDAMLPGPLFETAREAFLAADFSPGQLHGQAVKAWMRVEVNFEADQVSPPP